MINIYQITNLINNKKYIGQTKKSIEKRFQEHISESKNNPKYKIHRAINKYGEKNFIIDIIMQCDNQNEANISEIKYIEKFKTQNNEYGYNIASGGQGGDIKSVSQKYILSEKMKVENPMFSIKCSSYQFNLWKEKVSDGTKLGQKLSDKFKQQQKDNIVRLKENNPNKMYDINVRQKLSSSQKIRYQNNPELKRFGKDNCMFGRQIFYEQSIEWQNEQREKSSQLRHSEVYQCPFCHKIIKTTANFYKHCRSIHQKSDDEIKTIYKGCLSPTLIPVSQEDPNIP